MPIKMGINGFGRIARVVFRAVSAREDIVITGVNIRNADPEYMAYMLRYDSVFGRFDGELGHYDKGLIVNGKKIPVYSYEDASQIPWTECGAEYLIEATGVHLTAESNEIHLKNGIKKVIISAPAKDKVTPTFVYGVNHEEYESSMDVVSAASCTTNCLAPLCKVVHENYGIVNGLMATIHAVTSKQKVVDSRSMKDWRAGRSVFENIIPSTTGAAKAIGLVIPDLQGAMTGISYRIPVADVSVVDLNVLLSKPANYEDICKKIKAASEGSMKGVLEYVDDEVVSGDFKGDPNPCIFDVRQGIQLNDKMFKFVAFYDNEWGYSCNMINLVKYMAEVDAKK